MTESERSEFEVALREEQRRKSASCVHVSNRFLDGLVGRQPVTESERSEFEVALREDEKGRKSMYCAVQAQKQRFLQQI